MVNVHGLYTNERAAEIATSIEDGSFWKDSFR